MTSKTSLFNKGIFLSTIKRFLWGSILYFAALFLFNILPLLVSEPNDFRYGNIRSGWYLFQYGINTFNIIISSVVPYVAALLAFRFLHSKKQSIFVHSLPLNRRTVYISTTIAVMFLMIAPVVINGLILTLMSVSKYSGYISITSVITWMALNVLCHIVMFSVAALCCTITGNSFGAAVIYFIVHLTPIIISSMSNEFLHDFILGFGGENDITNIIGEINPFTFLIRISECVSNLSQVNVRYVSADILKWIPVYLVVSAALYIVSYYLYKMRKLENVEEVSGFKVMNPIFKYLVTFTVAISTLAAIANFHYISPVTAIVTFILTTAVSYFICEMVLKKTLRVFGSYKGYAGFVCVIVFILIVSKVTGGFGYENYIPDLNEIKSVSVSSYNGYKGDVKISDKDFKEFALNIHKERIEKGILIKDNDSRFAPVNINYEMNKGNTVKRRYFITENEMNDMFDKLYTFDIYVKNYDDFYSVDEDKIIEMQLNDDKHSRQFGIDVNQQKGLYDALEKDRLSLTFKEMNCISNTYTFSISVKYLYTEEADVYYNSPREYTRTISFMINPYYKNTIKWLENEGYLDLIKIPHNGKLYIRQGGFTYKDGVENLSDTIVIDNESHVNEILDYVSNNPTRSTASELVYTIYYNPVPQSTSSVRELCEVNFDMMPAVFKQYIKIKLLK